MTDSYSLFPASSIPASAGVEVGFRFDEATRTWETHVPLLGVHLTGFLTQEEALNATSGAIWDALFEARTAAVRKEWRRRCARWETILAAAVGAVPTASLIVIMGSLRPALTLIAAQVLEYGGAAVTIPVVVLHWRAVRRPAFPRVAKLDEDGWPVKPS